MPQKPLPSSPNLDHLKRQARELQAAHRNHESQASQRIREFHPRLRGASDEAIFAAKFPLSAAQLTVAREYGLPNWPKLRAYVTGSAASAAARPHHERISDPDFRRAVDLLDAGESDALRKFLAEHPGLITQRIPFDVTDYFGAPTLLEFVAENPIRRRSLPSNIVAVARTILEAGAKNDLAAVDRTLGLVASGCIARECGVQIPLIDLLCEYNADPNPAMSAALGQGEFAAVDALLRHGAQLTLEAAAAIGRDPEFRHLLPSASSAERHRALALSAQFGRLEIVRVLLDAGEDPSRYNPVGYHAHSTPLHQAAMSGFFDVVRLLVERGADVTVEDTIYHGTPAGWAEHAGQLDIAAFLRQSP